MIAYLLVIGSAVIFGITPTIQKTLLNSGMSVASLMMFIGMLMLVFSFVRVKRRGMSLKIDKKATVACVIRGIFGNLLTGGLMSLAYLYLPVGVVTMLNFLYPAIVTAAMFVLFGQRISVLKILAIISSLRGMSCLVSMKGELSATGIVFAILSAFSYAAYYVLNEKSVVSQVPFEVRHFYSVLAGPFFFIPYTLLSHSLTVPGTFAQVVQLLMIIVLSFMATSFLMKGIEKTGAVTASFISLVEPVVSVACGIIFLGESLTIKIIAGGVLIFASMILTTISDARE